MMMTPTANGRLRRLALILLAGLACVLSLPAAANPPKQQQAFYKRLKTAWLSKNAGAVAANFGTHVNLRLSGGKLKRYRRDQAINVVRTHLSGITPVPKNSRITHWSPTSMTLSVSYWKDGALRRSSIYFTVRASGGGYVVTTISR